MVARRAFLFLYTLEDACPILFIDDSLRHAFTRPGLWDHPHPRAATRAPTPPNSSPAPTRNS